MKICFHLNYFDSLWNVNHISTYSDFWETWSKGVKILCPSSGTKLHLHQFSAKYIQPFVSGVTKTIFFYIYKKIILRNHLQYDQTRSPESLFVWTIILIFLIHLLEEFEGMRVMSKIENKGLRKSSWSRNFERLSTALWNIRFQQFDIN